MNLTASTLIAAAAALAAAAAALAVLVWAVTRVAAAFSAARDRARGRAAARAQDRAAAGRAGRTWLDILFAVVIAGLFTVAVLGACISFETLQREATVHLGSDLAGTAFPLLADAWIAFSTGAYVVRARQGKRRPGYKLAAYVGIVATILLNAQGTDGAAGLLWHVWPPAVWAGFLELAALDAIATARREGLEESYVARDRLTGGDWFNPVRALRLLAHRRATGISNLTAVAQSLAMTDAAVLTVRRALPLTAGPFAWSVRRTIIRTVRTRQLDPRAVLALTKPDPAPTDGRARTRPTADPDALLRAALARLPQEPTASTAAPTAFGGAPGPAPNALSASGSASGRVAANAPGASGTAFGGGPTARPDAHPEPEPAAPLDWDAGYNRYVAALRAALAANPRPAAGRLEPLGTDVAAWCGLKEGRTRRLEYRRRLLTDEAQLAADLAARRAPWFEDEVQPAAAPHRQPEEELAPVA